VRGTISASRASNTRSSPPMVTVLGPSSRHGTSASKSDSSRLKVSITVSRTCRRMLQPVTASAVCSSGFSASTEAGSCSPSGSSRSVCSCRTIDSCCCPAASQRCTTASSTLAVLSSSEAGSMSMAVGSMPTMPSSPSAATLLRVDQQFSGHAVGDPVRFGVVEVPRHSWVLAAKHLVAVGLSLHLGAEQAGTVSRGGNQGRGVLRGEVQRDRLLARLRFRGNSAARGW